MLHLVYYSVRLYINISFVQIVSFLFQTSKRVKSPYCSDTFTKIEIKSKRNTFDQQFDDFLLLLAVPASK